MSTRFFLLLLLLSYTALAKAQVQCDSIPTDTVPADSICNDSMRTDTLPEVEVIGGPSPISKSIGRNIEEWKKRPQTPTLGQMLQQYAPNLNDIILHPFGFKQRRVERQRKRTQKILEHYDHVKTFEELMQEALERQRVEQEEK